MSSSVFGVKTGMDLFFCSLVCTLQTEGPPDTLSTADISLTIDENLMGTPYYIKGTVSAEGFTFVVRSDMIGTQRKGREGTESENKSKT
ncbi:hypothetical protein XELAEV_18000223mg [Xenopus laevis]|uniref:Uncharacterized protein n=1 Tax=Xenopus laevis TaxID=8355 RepID=A0A974BPH4_XENLA|nr:hypothetical protein XELAEV_18000223mg [Xenopus laevis]